MRRGLLASARALWYNGSSQALAFPVSAIYLATEGRRPAGPVLQRSVILAKAMHIVSPKPQHVASLMRLSLAFGGEQEWASTIPIGQITTEETAVSRLSGPDALVVLVAETEEGEMAGYAGIYEHDGGAYLSILVDAAYRHKGVGRALVEALFRRLPAGMAVESWVGEFNEVSRKAMPGLGFSMDRVIQDGGRQVCVFVRRS